MLLKSLNVLQKSASVLQKSARALEKSPSVVQKSVSVLQKSASVLQKSAKADIQKLALHKLVSQLQVNHFVRFVMKYHLMYHVPELVVICIPSTYCFHFQNGPVGKIYFILYLQHSKFFCNTYLVRFHLINKQDLSIEWGWIIFFSSRNFSFVT